MNPSITEAVRARTTSPLEPDYISSPLALLPQEVRLRDGCRLRLRELRSEDRERLKAFFDRCSPEAIRYRFMSSIKAPSDSLLDYLADADGLRHVALIITEGEGADEKIVAEGRYVIFKERPSAADIAFLVV